MKSCILFIVILFTPLYLCAQILKGKVSNTDSKPLKGATLFWLHTETNTTANNKGEFEIPIPKEGTHQFVARMVGYQPDTLTIDSQTVVEIKLTSYKELKGIPTSNHILLTPSPVFNFAG